MLKHCDATAVFSAVPGSVLGSNVLGSAIGSRQASLRRSWTADRVMGAITGAVFPRIGDRGTLLPSTLPGTALNTTVAEANAFRPVGGQRLPHISATMDVRRASAQLILTTSE